MDAEQGALMDFAEKAIALGFAEDEFLKMLELFVATTTEDISKLRTAIDANAMTIAAAAAHSIKGAARGFDFDELSREAEAIEIQARCRDLGQTRDLLAGLEARLAEIVDALEEYR
jgi:HPt (histidine-containing phosphotransfer) domain-containing protein